jgi:hypothetical protein
MAKADHTKNEQNQSEERRDWTVQKVQYTVDIQLKNAKKRGENNLEINWKKCETAVLLYIKYKAHFILYYIYYTYLRCEIKSFN